MHYHCEIVMPPTDDIEAAVKEIMHPFDEHEDENAGAAFWDFWVIGGRWAGAKLKATLDPDKLDAFYKALQRRKVTVSGFTAGKQSLQPESQIPMVDELWGEFFPDQAGTACPLFAHSNDQYDSSSLINGDVCRYAQVPEALKMKRVIYAGPHHYDGEIELKGWYMLTTEFWNGITHQETTWKGDFEGADKMMRKHSEHYADAYKDRVMPQPDWIVVTVDYHS